MGSATGWSLAVIVPAIATVAWTLLSPTLSAHLKPWLSTIGSLGALAFIGVGALAAALCAPTSLVYVTGGALFGLIPGALYNSLAGAISSSCAFALSRSLFGQRMAKLFARHAKLERFESALNERALWLCVLLRLSPLLPLGPLSYSLGLTRVSTRNFVLSLPALVPSAFAYTYLGYAASSLFGHGKRSVLEWALLALGFLATIGAAWLVGRAARRALDRQRHGQV